MLSTFVEHTLNLYIELFFDRIELSNNSRITSFIEIISESLLAIESDQDIPIAQTFLKKDVIITLQVVLKVIEQIFKMVEILE